MFSIDTASRGVKNLAAETEDFSQESVAGWEPAACGDVVLTMESGAKVTFCASDIERAGQES